MSGGVRGRRTAAAGVLVLLGVALLALLAPLVAPCEPLKTDLDGALRGPSAGHLFGQDRLGRDVLSQVIYGARASTIIALEDDGPRVVRVGKGPLESVLGIRPSLLPELAQADED